MIKENHSKMKYFVRNYFLMFYCLIIITAKSKYFPRHKVRGMKIEITTNSTEEDLKRREKAEYYGNNTRSEEEEEANSESQKMLFVYVMIVILIVIIFLVVCLCNIRRFIGFLTRIYRRMCYCCLKKEAKERKESVEERMHEEEELSVIGSESEESKSTSSRTRIATFANLKVQGVDVFDVTNATNAMNDCNVSKEKNVLVRRGTIVDQMHIKQSYLNAGALKRRGTLMATPLVNSLSSASPGPQLSFAMGQKTPPLAHSTIPHFTAKTPFSMGNNIPSPVITSTKQELKGGAVKLTIKRHNRYSFHLPTSTAIRKKTSTSSLVDN